MRPSFHLQSPQFGQTAIVHLGNPPPDAMVLGVGALDRQFLGTQDPSQPASDQYRTTLPTQFGNVYLASGSPDAVARVSQQAQAMGLPAGIVDTNFTPDKAREALLNFTGNPDVGQHFNQLA